MDAAINWRKFPWDSSRNTGTGLRWYLYFLFTDFNMLPLHLNLYVIQFYVVIVFRLVKQSAKPLSFLL